MGALWTAWHLFFCLFLRKRGPRSVEVRDEVRLSEEVPRLDYLLLRKGRPGAPHTTDDDARTLRRLWPMLPYASIVEYKSPTHPYRRGQLDRLWGYVHIYFANQWEGPGSRGATGHPPQAPPRKARKVRAREALAAVLIVARRSPSLDADTAAMGLTWEDCGGGYWRVGGGAFALYVVEIDVAGPAEGDDVLTSLGHGNPMTPEARQFWVELVGSKEAGMSMQDLEGYDELMRKFLDSLPLEQRLAGLPPEQRLAGLPPEEVLSRYAPEQRLAGLDHDHQALALPLDVLRLLPEEYLRSLSPEVQAELRRRLERNGH